MPGSFGRLIAEPAPICETVCCCAVSWHSVPGSFGRLLVEPAPICKIICCCLLNWRSVPGSFGLCFSVFVIRFGDPPAICRIPWHQTYRLYQHAGQFRTFFRLLWHRMSDPPAICGISRRREGVPGSLDACLRNPQLSAGLLSTGVAGFTGMPGSCGLCFGFYGVA